jgi:hypothetical protein
MTISSNARAFRFSKLLRLGFYIDFLSDGANLKTNGCHSCAIAQYKHATNWKSLPQQALAAAAAADVDVAAR